MSEGSKESKSFGFIKLNYQIFAYIVFIVLILSNGIWFFPLLSRTKEEAAFLQMETAKRAQDEASHYINNHIDEAKLITSNIVINEDKKSLLNTLLRDDDIQQVAFINSNGKEVLKFHRYRVIYPEELKNRFNEEGVQKVFLSGEIYTGPVFTENLEPMLNIIIPLKIYEKEISGALEVVLNLKTLWEKVGSLQVGTRGSVYIVNSNGMVIVHKDPSMVLAGTYVLDKDIIRRLVLDKQVVDGLGPESHYSSIDNIDVFGVGVPIENLDWGVVAEQPWADAFAARREIITLVGIGFGLSVVLLLLLQIVIRILSKISKELTQKYGQLEVQRNELDKTTKTLTKRDLLLSETREWLRTALVKSDKARIDLILEKNKVEAVLSGLMDGLMVLDDKGKIVSINPSAEKIFSVNKDAVIGKNREEVSRYEDLEKLFKLISENVICQIFCQLEIILNNRTFQIVATPFKGEKENISGSIITIHDITREKNVERMKTEFVSLAAHQLRTPLSAIKWILRTVLDGDVGEISKEQFEMINKGYESNERMISLINDLLNVARIEEGRFLYNFTEKSIEEIIEKIIINSKEQAEKNKVKVSFEKPLVPLPKINIDAEKMELALQNILDNGIIYNQPGGKVTISVKSDNINIEIKIEDTGIGIPKLQQENLFNKFFRADNAMRASADGSGLGLFIGKNIIEAHKGKIHFESEENKGTKFLITIPIN